MREADAAEAPPFIDLRVNFKRGRFTAPPGGRIRHWLVLSNAGTALAPGRASAPDTGYTVEMFFLNDRRQLEPVPRLTDYRKHVLSPPLALAQLPDLGPAQDMVRAFEVTVPEGSPGRLALCAVIEWANPRVELNKRDNFDCATVEVAGTRTPAIRYLSTAGEPGASPRIRLEVTPARVARIPGLEPSVRVELDAAEHRELLAAMRAAISAGVPTGTLCRPGASVYTLQVGEERLRVPACSRGALGGVFERLDALVERLRSAAE